MPTTAQDSNKIPRLLLVDSDGKLILGAGTDKIGNVNEARGKTILYDRASKASGDETVRTVTSNKTYYLLQAGLQYHATVDERDAILYVTNANNVLLRLVSKVTATYFAKDTNSISVTYPHPIPIAEDLLIRVYSGDAGLTADAWIVGWEE